MKKVIALEIATEAWPCIFEAGAVTLTASEIQDLQYWILMFTHGYSTALVGGKLTDDEVELLQKARKAAAALDSALQKLKYGLLHRLEKADEVRRRQTSGYSILTELATDGPHLRLIGPTGLPEVVKLFRSATDTVLMTPVRKTGERNRSTGHFMARVNATFDAAERRELPRRTKWGAFFREFYRALPKPTQKLLVSEDAALKQFDRTKPSRTR